MNIPSMSRQEFTEMEMAYTQYEDACKDPVMDGHKILRQCRRPKRHPGSHASNYPYMEWANEGDES